MGSSRGLQEEMCTLPRERGCESERPIADRMLGEGLMDLYIELKKEEDASPKVSRCRRAME